MTLTLPASGAVLAALIPAPLFLVASALYNYARFGKFSEFGVTYIMTDSCQTGWRKFEFDNLWRGLCSYFMGEYHWAGKYVLWNGFMPEWYTSDKYLEHAGSLRRFVGNSVIWLGNIQGYYY